MKLISYIHQGSATFGAVDGNDVVDLGRRLGISRLRLALAEKGLIALEKASLGQRPDASFNDIELLPVVPDPGKIICIGINYENHRLETGRDVMKYPTIFTRFAESQTGHRRPLVKPRLTEVFDYEGELAVVIGKAGRYIAEQDALSYVAGYSCYNDGSVRDWQRHTTQFTPGKNFPQTGGFGPWLVTSDELTDPSKLTLVTRLNGQELQRATTAELIFSVPALLAYVSTFTPLSPGDVLVTGTPGGVGYKRDPQIFMKHGDVVEVEISEIGTLSNPVIEEGRA